MLFAHLRENELRGSLPFIDKAHAVFDAKSLLEAELSVDTLSQRQLETLFKERGFSLSHSMISKMGYAVQTLWPVMPIALSAGLGRPQVEKIRALERAVRHIWLHRQLGEESLFDDVFAELCRRYDCSEWDIQPLRHALQHEIAVESEQSEQIIHLEIDASLAGRPFEYPATFEEDSEEALQEGEPNKPAVMGEESQVSTTAPKPRAHQDAPERPVWEEESPDRSNHTIEVPADRATGARDLGSLDIPSLRRHLHATAAHLAQHHGLGDRVIPLADHGLGFLVTDVPPTELTETLDQEMLGLVSLLWWQLVACSEVTAAPVDILLNYLDESSILHRALASQDAELLFSNVWTLDPGHMGCQLWQQLNPEDWQLLLQMMETYRALKRRAFDAGFPLWDAAEGGS